VNVQFGTGFTIGQVNTGAQGSEARSGVAVPAQSENQSTTSFVPVEQASESPESRQEGAEKGSQERQAVEASRARQQQENQKERQQLERRARDERQQASSDALQQRQDEQQQALKSDEVSDRTQEEDNAQARRQQDEMEQRQLEADQKQLQQLAERDREVKAHEQAHQTVGGQYAGSMSLTYERGPNGQNYAVAGEVSIDISEVANDPESTLDKAEIVRRAALAPAEPSSQDRRVAAQAAQMELEARAEIQQQQLQQEEALTNNDVSEEQSEIDRLREEERQEEEQKAQQEEQEKQQESTKSVIADLQELNERMARIQAQLVEASQIDDKINSKVNLLDVTT